MKLKRRVAPPAALKMSFFTCNSANELFWSKLTDSHLQEEKGLIINMNEVAPHFDHKGHSSTDSLSLPPFLHLPQVILIIMKCIKASLLGLVGLGYFKASLAFLLPTTHTTPSSSSSSTRGAIQTLSSSRYALTRLAGKRMRSG